MERKGKLEGDGQELVNICICGIGEKCVKVKYQGDSPPSLDPVHPSGTSLNIPVGIPQHQCQCPGSGVTTSHVVESHWSMIGDWKKQTF